MMHLFRMNTPFKLLELLSFKGIFMRRKKSLSLIWFKYCQSQQKLHSQKLIKNAESFLVGEELSRQNAVLLQLCTHEVDWPVLPFLCPVALFPLSFLVGVCACVIDKSPHPLSPHIIVCFFFKKERKKPALLQPCHGLTQKQQDLSCDLELMWEGEIWLSQCVS